MHSPGLFRQSVQPRDLFAAAADGLANYFSLRLGGDFVTDLDQFGEHQGTSSFLATGRVLNFRPQPADQPLLFFRGTLGI